MRVSGGGAFTVRAAATGLDSALGFMGFPIDASCPYRQIFFYAHGVNAKESDLPIGTMLIASGLVDEEALARGIEAQSAAHGARVGEILVEQGALDQPTLDAAAALQARRKLRIGEVLIEAGLATTSAVDRALDEQRKRKGKRLGEVLVDMGIVTEGALMRTLAKKFALPFVDLDQVKVNPAAALAVGVDIIAKYGVLPVGINAAMLTVAIGDPLAVEAIDVLRFHTKRRIDELLVTPSQLKLHVQAFLAAQHETGTTLERILKEMTADELNASADVDEDEANEVDAAGARETDGGVIRLVNQIIIDACRAGASDIHVEPNGKERDAVVRFRVDGDCIAYKEIPAALRGPVIARIKIMAGLDIAERRKPQDGKIKFKIGTAPIELRVATLPTVNGNEDAVLRILASAKPLPLERMGLSDRNLRELRRLIAQPYGLILCVGPTGSGKTTTLHSALGAINTVDMKIWTAEDPVEITQPGLRQVQVQTKIGFTFAAAMRAFLRADPDVIMVGEMRDLETASTAIEASLTGHLVMSTLHTNTAPETLTRLLDLGLDPFSFSDSLLGVLAQRLARALCKVCRRARVATPDEVSEIVQLYGGVELLERNLGIVEQAPLSISDPVGCSECKNTGYKGRLALHELLVTDDGMRGSIARKAPVEELRRAAVAGGMTTLLQDGIAKCLAGLTDLKQVLAVCSK